MRDFYCSEAISVTASVRIPSHTVLLYTLPVLSKARTRSEVSIPKFAADIFSKFKLQFQQHFLNLNASTMKTYIFQNPFNYAIEAPL